MEETGTFNNTSGQGEQTTLPPELAGWNWGAFLLNWIWGIGNNSFLTFLMFVPCVNIVVPFICGAKGNEWAWKNKRWESIEEFRRIQKKWAMAGLIIIAAAIVLICVFIVAMMAMFKQSVAYEMSFERAVNHPLVIEQLGTPIEDGFFMTGNISVNGPSGEANISFPISGPNGSATVYSYAEKHLGEWEILEMLVEIDATGERIQIVPDESNES